MRHYLYSYQTIIRFNIPVSQHFFSLRCVPPDNDCQRIERRDLFVYPSDNVSRTTDAWGNLQQYGSCLEPHDRFVFTSSGEAFLTPYRIPDNGDNTIYRVHSAMTGLTNQMADFINGAQLDGTPLQQTLQLAQMVHTHISYVAGSTTIETNAGAAFNQRQGVCQDFAHILIALCRARGLAARYVNGFILGVGETHAWMEVYDDGAWHGIDPTYNQLIEYGYVKLSHGRDAMDCQVSRGRFTGLAEQQVEVRVIVQEL